MFREATKPGIQQRIELRIGRRGQDGAGVPFPAVMHHWLAVQIERLCPLLHAFEHRPHLARTTRENGVETRETPLAPRPIVLVAEAVRGQQQLQRRVLAMLHHELLNDCLYLRVNGVHDACANPFRWIHSTVSSPGYDEPPREPTPPPKRRRLMTGALKVFWQPH